MTTLTYRQPDDNHREWRSGIVEDGGKMATNLVASKHTVVVVRGVNHYVRVKVSGRPQHLIRRPHVTKLTSLRFGIWPIA